MIFLQIYHKLDEPAIYLRPFSPLIVTKTFVNGKQTSLRMPGFVPGVALKLLPIELSGSSAQNVSARFRSAFYYFIAFVEVIKI